MTVFKIDTKYDKNINREVFEVVERKGVGHPDSLADLIAETYSKKYSEFCLKKFGVILNHSSDKVLLSGAKVDVTFGKFKVLKPITAYLFGKSTVKVNNVKIDIAKIFKESVRHVFSGVFGVDILKHVNYVVDINDGVGLEHLKDFYMPNLVSDFKKLKENNLANDSVVCSAFAGYSDAEHLTIFIENYINSLLFKKKFPETGYDVKVLTMRSGVKSFDITICVPFIASRTKNLEFYKKRLVIIKSDVLNKIKKIIKGNDVKLFVNTKDTENSAYLTVFGTALDKGDFGVVGRGNRYNGVISVNRGMSIEAVSGKNPLHHAGKIYTILSQDIANDVYTKFKVENYVNIVSRNGDSLNNPAIVVIKFNKNISKSEIVNIIKKNINKIESYTSRIIKIDPVKNFKKLKTIKI